MVIKQVNYVASYPREDLCPKDKKPEYAFIGRSNVGKSSLINMLCQKKELAKVSKQPGKTQMINYFDVDSTWYLVDLPGYGYAKRAQSTRASWEKMIYYYLKHRVILQAAMVLIDSRIPLQKIDLEFLKWLGAHSIPFVIVFTKVDKLKKNEATVNIDSIKKELSNFWEPLPQTFITSAENGTGREEILEFVDGVNQHFHKNH